MKKFSRRKVLKSILGISLYSIIPFKLEAFSFFHERNFSIFGTNKTNVMSFKLPELNYEYNALEPHFDARTMEIHHSKHHAGYTNNLNNLISGTEFEGKPIEEILKSTNAVYLTNGLSSLKLINSLSLDFVWSHSVLEHIRKSDFLDIQKEFYKQ